MMTLMFWGTSECPSLLCVFLILQHQTRAIMAKEGLPTPKNFLIKEQGQVEEAGTHVGFPAVIKPIHGAASLGVIRVENFDELHKVRQDLRRRLLALVIGVDVSVVVVLW